MWSLRLVRTLLVALAVAAGALLVLVVAGRVPALWVAATPSVAGVEVPIGVRLEPVPVLLLALVSTVGALVAAYAVRNLVGRPAPGRTALGLAAAVLGLAAAVTTPSTLVLGLGWSLATVAVVALVAGGGTPGAPAAARVVGRRLAVGDLALWGAVLVLGLGLGTWRVDQLESAVAGPTSLVVAVAVLLVGAGVVRSALVPGHRWLPETTEAPSPVSALLHAGVVNGLGVLVLLLWPVIDAVPAVRAALVVVGAATLALGTAQLRTRPDVKGRLVASTSAQMGFVGVTAGLGLPAAVLAHVIGHGLWKAGLFLGAGGAIDRMRSTPPSTAHGPQPLRPGDVVPALVVVGLAAVVPGPWGPPLLEGPAALLPLAAAALATVVALRAARAERHGRRPFALAATLVLVAAAAYLLGLRALTHAVGLPVSTPWGAPAAPVVLVVVGALLALAAAGFLLDRRVRAGLHPRLAADVARTSLPPVPVRDRLTAPRVRPGWGEARAGDAARTRSEVEVAAAAVGPLWPLGSFVASSPVSGLEQLPFPHAMRLAARAWGSAAGPDAALYGAALDAGRIPSWAVRQAVTEAGLDRAPSRRVPDPVAVVAALLREDGRDERPAVRTPGERLTDGAGARAAARARELGHHLTARACLPTPWGYPAGVWEQLRAQARLGGLDAALAVRGADAAVLALPEHPEAAVAVLLRHLGVEDDQRVPLLTRLLARDPGWTGHLAWRRRRGVPVRGAITDPLPAGPEDLVDLAAVRLALECVVVEAHGPLGPEVVLLPGEGDLLARGTAAAGLREHEIDAAEREHLVDLVRRVDLVGVGELRLRAWEHAVRAPVRAAVVTPPVEARAEAGDRAPVAAQVVTCIDVRSERLRRHLERLGPWETYGHAGFFGLAVSVVAADGSSTERCPAPVRAGHLLVERPTRTGRWAWTTTDAGEAVHAVEAAPAAPLALAEAAGWAQAPVTVLRTAAPAAWARTVDAVRRRAGAPRQGGLEVVGPHAVPLPEAIAIARDTLRTLGLVAPAPLVLLVGHGGAAPNNPHVAAYDCGACGGQPGGTNARALALLLNDDRVRDGLRQHGVDIPARTWFVAAVHDTTRDEVEVLDRDLLPEPARPVLAALEADLGRALDAVAEERARDLPAGPRRAVRAHLRRRAADWAQPQPEWGLAGACALVIGPRRLTSGAELDGRVFLQSYDPDLDPAGDLLAGLFGGPLVVAQWITQQYWCSTVDPERFGAGDKTTHNVVAPADGVGLLSGVLTGARGDLRVGLPWQAVSATAPSGRSWSGGLPQHDPVRLQVLVHAPRERVEEALRAVPDAARLVVGGWIALTVVEPGDGRLWERDVERGWVPVEGDPLPAPVG